VITRSQIKYEIYTRLNKTAATKGFYSDEKANSAIQEAIDYIATKCFLADEGWNHKLLYFDTQANMVSLPIPADMIMIHEVRYLVGNVYIPLTYDQQFGEAQWAGQSGVIQFPSRYKLIDNQIYFNPALSVGGPQYLQIEFTNYPRRLQKDSDFVESQFDRSMYWFCVYHSMVILTTGVQMNTDWPAQEGKWLQAMTDVINMRTRQAIPIRDFDGF